uniref:ShKT domain-containing protein n=1 Tax=Acrobeloides nanus TaxID=290746 RepID=A0A914CZY5_9BILA
MNVKFMTRMVGSLLGQITFLSVVLEAVIYCGAQYNPLIPNYCRFGLNRCYGGLLGGYGYPGAGYGGQYNPYTIGSGLGLGAYGLGSSYNPYATGLGYGLGSNYGIYNPYSPLSTASTYTSGLYSGGLGNTMCVDRSTDCAYYASSGQCATTPYVMRNLCPISCGFGCDYTGGL